MKWLVLITVLFCGVIDGKNIPSNIKTCSRNDPNLNECFMNHGNLAMQYIAKGDPEYNIETLLPLKWRDILVVETPTNPTFKISLFNITVYELENTKITKANIDLNARKIQFTLFNPSITWKQHYKASVEILNLHHEVGGKADIEFIDGEYFVNIDFDLKNINGVEYAEIINHKIEFVNYRINFQFENLESNKIIEKYWKTGKKYFLTPDIIKECSKTVAGYVSNIFKNVPYDLIFTP